MADYVPFYFATRSPMLFRIHKRGVDGYQRRQEELVYLATRLSVVRQARLSWLATNMNAAVAPARFVDRVEDLPDYLDVEVLEAEQWADTPEDGGRKQRRMAELLVHGCVPWTVFTHVAVHSEAEARRLRALLPERSSRPAVIVRAGWYF